MATRYAFSTPSPSTLASSSPRFMYVRTVRGSTPKASAATLVVTQPDDPRASAPASARFPRVLSWSIEGYTIPLDRGPALVSQQPRVSGAGEDKSPGVDGSREPPGLRRGAEASKKEAVLGQALDGCSPTIAVLD